MEWMNYHHLLYFWTVVRAGSISKASEQLRVSSPAISAQLRSLEENFGEKLLRRSGRNLVMTEMGRTVFSYAEDIFSLGRELMDTVRNRPTGRPMRLDIGIVDVLPKLIAQWLIEPALHLREPVRIVCREATSDQLIARLATLELDLVGEFEDYALLRAFGQAGTGIFPVPSVFEKQLKQQDSLRRVGRTEEVHSRFFAISAERKLKHPAVLAICDSARRDLFDIKLSMTAA
jgi:DNA-binding transcriptional LysR family regulator